MTTAVRPRGTCARVISASNTCRGRVAPQCCAWPGRVGLLQPLRSQRRIRFAIRREENLAILHDPRRRHRGCTPILNPLTPVTTLARRARELCSMPRRETSVGYIQRPGKERWISPRRPSGNQVLAMPSKPGRFSSCPCQGSALFSIVHICIVYVAAIPRCS